MRILVDARVGWGSGIGRVIVNTVGRVARSRPDFRFDLLVNAQNETVARDLADGIENLAVRVTGIQPFTAMEQVALRREARGYDLTWFCNYWVPLNWTGRFVVIVHDLLHLDPDLFPASPIKRALAWATFATVRRRATAVMFNSRFTKRCFEDRFGEALRPVVLTLGADHLCRSDAPIRVSARIRRLLVVAASKKHKNFPMVLDAWRQARVAGDWRLTIVTPEAMLRSEIDLPRYIAENGSAELRRGVSDEELGTLFAESAIVLVPSLFEGFGLPLVEGMRAGALCVISEAESLVEVAEGCFVLVANGRDQPGWSKAIESACSLFDAGSDVDLDALLEHNRRQSARFAWDDTAAQIAGVIDQALLA